MNKFFLCSFFLLISCYSEDYIDIEKSIQNRKEKYLLNGYKQVVVCSPYRSGSTLIFNVLKYLFDDVSDVKKLGSYSPYKKIVKTHYLLPYNPNTLVFLPVRNPVDACYSYYRVVGNGKDGKTQNITASYIVDDFLKQFSTIKPLIYSKNNVVLLKYEEFNENFARLFDVIEQSLGIVIHEEDKDSITKIFSKENVVKHTELFANFSEYNLKTHFHGDHIDPNNIAVCEQKILKDELKNELQKKISQLGMKALFEDLGC